jgi:hypothetical protein
METWKVSELSAVPSKLPINGSWKNFDFYLMNFEFFVRICRVVFHIQMKLDAGKMTNIHFFPTRVQIPIFLFHSSVTSNENFNDNWLNKIVPSNIKSNIIFLFFIGKIWTKKWQISIDTKWIKFEMGSRTKSQ